MLRTTSFPFPVRFSVLDLEGLSRITTSTSMVLCMFDSAHELEFRLMFCG